VVENGILHAVRVLEHPGYSDNIPMQFVAMRFLCMMGKHGKCKKYSEFLLRKMSV
jgi:hypothetical protein